MNEIFCVTEERAYALVAIDEGLGAQFTITNEPYKSKNLLDHVFGLVCWGFVRECNQETALEVEIRGRKYPADIAVCFYEITEIGKHLLPVVEHLYPRIRENARQDKEMCLDRKLTLKVR